MGLIKTLNLDEEYFLEVRVKDTDQLFAGQLSLKPTGCNLRVMSERQPSDGFIDNLHIECSTIWNKFLLFNLKTSGLKWTRLAKQADSNIIYYEINFEIGYVVCSRNIYFDNLLVRGYQIKSPMLNDWIGITTTQNTIMMDKTEFVSDEFELIIEDNRVIACSYVKNMHIDQINISMGTKITPFLHTELIQEVSMFDIFKDVMRLYDLMAYFYGGDFKLTSITLNIGSRIETSLYFSTAFQKINSSTSIVRLDHNKMYSDSSVKPLDLICFEKYFNLSEEKQEIFSKYLRYKRLNSNEEKFLGYFRLLEKLSYREESYVDTEQLETLLSNSKNFLVNKLKSNSKNIRNLSKRILKLNRSKYNTEGCIRKFYDGLTIHFKNQLNFDIKNLNEVTKLRNNITHANAYVHDEGLLWKYTSFIHALLYMSLILELGIDIEVGDKIVSRINNVK